MKWFVLTLISFGLLTLASCSLESIPEPKALDAQAVTDYGTQLFSGNYKEVEYSRVIKLANGNLLAAFAVEYSTNNGAIRFYKSMDNGSSFSFVSEFRDTLDSLQIGAPALVEVSPGTVSLAYNKFDNNAFEKGQRLKIVRSTNGGASWTPVTTLESDIWSWEPEFARSSDGKLQLYYSFATTLKPFSLSTFDQVIVRRESSDNGATWGPRITAVGNNNDNVGMARIVKVGGTYYMAFDSRYHLVRDTRTLQNNV